MHYQQVIDFWFGELDQEQWWRTDQKLDRTIEDRFGALHRAAACCELYPWRAQADGRLAEIIVLDQFSRNIHRGSAAAFACDPLALALAQEAINVGADDALEPVHRCFLYMPFMHSESVPIHEAAVTLFTRLDLGSHLDFEMKHKAIIDRFGRYPHRNTLLSRESTAEELEFLRQPGSSF